jgi:hypothetical protein
MFTLASVGHNL